MMFRSRIRINIILIIIIIGLLVNVIVADDNSLIGVVRDGIGDNDEGEHHTWKFGDKLRNHIRCRRQKQKCNSSNPNDNLYRLWNCNKYNNSSSNNNNNYSNTINDTSDSNTETTETTTNICKKENKFISCTQNTTTISQMGIFGCIKLCVPDPNLYIQSTIEQWQCGDCQMTVEATILNYNDTTTSTMERELLNDNDERQLINNNAPSATPTFAPTRTIPTSSPTAAVPIVSATVTRAPVQVTTSSPTAAVPITTTIVTKAPVAPFEPNRCKRLAKYEACSNNGTKIYRIFPSLIAGTPSRCRSVCVTTDLKPYFSRLNYPNGSPWKCGKCPNMKDIIRTTKAPIIPTNKPTKRPTTKRPTKTPITKKPTTKPTKRPTKTPIITTKPTKRPTKAPSSPVTSANDRNNYCKKIGKYTKCRGTGTKIYRLFPQSRVVKNGRTCQEVCVTDVTPYFYRGQKWNCGICPITTVTAKSAKKKNKTTKKGKAGVQKSVKKQNKKYVATSVVQKSVKKQKNTASSSTTKLTKTTTKSKSKPVPTTKLNRTTTTTTTTSKSKTAATTTTKLSQTTTSKSKPVPTPKVNIKTKTTSKSIPTTTTTNMNKTTTTTTTTTTSKSKSIPVTTKSKSTTKKTKKI